MFAIFCCYDSYVFSIQFLCWKWLIDDHLVSVSDPFEARDEEWRAHQESDGRAIVKPIDDPLRVRLVQLAPERDVALQSRKETQHGTKIVFPPFENSVRLSLQFRVWNLLRKKKEKKR